MKSRKIRRPSKEARLSFTDHLSELRARFFHYLVFLCLGIGIGYIVHPHIISLLTKPLGQPLFYASVTGGFDFVFQISFFFGFLFSVPSLLYEVYRFVEPALPSRSSRKILPYLLASIVLLCMGIVFAYVVSLPATLYFLGSFAKGNIKTLISTTEYFAFISSYLVGFGLAFQLPLVLLFLDSVYPLPMQTLLRQQRFVIVGSFILAAVLTPTPDIVNQAIFAIPLILLYQCSLLAIWIRHRQNSWISYK
jgi:sec-independent protein translocase protein TatC